jgi:hypothetical protein
MAPAFGIGLCLDAGNIIGATGMSQPLENIAGDDVHLGHGLPGAIGAIRQRLAHPSP